MQELFCGGKALCQSAAVEDVKVTFEPNQEIDFPSCSAKEFFLWCEAGHQPAEQCRHQSPTQITFLFAICSAPCAWWDLAGLEESISQE